MAKGSQNFIVNFEDVRKEAHLGAYSEEYFKELAQYDVDEGLVAYGNLGGSLQLTHKGVKQVEAERRPKK